jgi:hypothetical protein
VDTVYGFVQDAIEKHGYTVSADISPVKKELEAIDEDVKKWTMGDVPVPHDVPKLYGEYYKIVTKKLSNSEYNLIEKNDMQNADKNKFTEVLFYMPNQSTSYYKNRFIKKSLRENKIFIADNVNGANEKEYDLECKTENRPEPRPYIKAAHPDSVAGWFKKTGKVLEQTEKLKLEIERYKERDLKHIYTNLFVDKEFALYIEKNLTDLKSEIEKNCELEAERIKSAIKKCCGDPATSSGAASVSDSLDIS